MNFPEVYSATGMMELIQKIGFLPLLDSGIEGLRLCKTSRRWLGLAIVEMERRNCAGNAVYVRKVL